MRRRFVKGTITKTTGGSHKMYSNGSIVSNAGGFIRESAGNQIIYGEPEDAPKKTVFLEDPIALAIVYFRPLKEWRGEYGFDWLREEDNGYNLEPPYKKIIEGGFKDGVSNLSPAEAYEQLKTEYKRIQISRKEKPEEGTNPDCVPQEYYVPYLTLFSEEFVEKLKSEMPEMLVKPCCEAELRMLVDIEEDLDKLEFEYNHEFFELSYDQLDERKKNKGLEPVKNHIKIKCLKDLNENKEICIYAYPKDTNSTKKLAGKIIVLKNDSTVRREEKIVLIRANTKAIKIQDRKKQETGEFSPEEKQYLYKALHQALIVSVVEETNLDLTKNKDFQIGGKRIENDFLKLFYRDDEGQLQKYLDLYKDCKNLLLDVKNAEGIKVNLRYEDYFTIFKFDRASNYSGTLGAVENIRTRNVIMLTLSSTNDMDKVEVRDNCTLNHETMHGLGLQHIHHPNHKGIIYSNYKYTYPYGEFSPDRATNNVMAYVKEAFSTWKWQWEIINPNIKELCKKI